ARAWSVPVIPGPARPGGQPDPTIVGDGGGVAWFGPENRR
ncbi:MAG: hypothetical protein QOE51_3072, partial [Actinoplanes sp.]|nr:hypothetical protein [Actinoplanes sp.]